MKHRKTILLFAFTVAVIFLFAQNQFIALASSLFAFALFLTFIALGVFNIRLNWFLNALSYPKSGQLCLTFDDGPDANTAGILNVLDKHGVKGTFFVIGKKCVDRPDILKRLVQDGHVVGNHSYSHRTSIGWSSTNTICREIEETNNTIREITGKSPVFYRPPFGVTNPNIARAISKMKMICTGWSLRSYDTVRTNGEELGKWLCAKLKMDGDIVLMHDTCLHSAMALDILIEEGKKRGLKFVTLEELIR